MDLILRWYQVIQSKSKAKKSWEQKASLSKGTDSGKRHEHTESEVRNDQIDGHEIGNKEAQNESQSPPEKSGNDSQKNAPEVSENEDGEEQSVPEIQEDQSERPCGVQDDPQNEQRGHSNADGAAGSADQGGEVGDIDSMMGSIVPLVQQEDFNMPSNGPKGRSSNSLDGLLEIPLPCLKPNDQITRLIQVTCDDPKIRKKVSIFEGDALEHVDGLIKGILSDRATEKAYEGYSLSVPLSISRRDAFSLSAGAVPIMWQKRMGVERPFIDLYVDVSGSMERYYGYIPYLYDALKHVMGRIFQFSTQVVQVEHDDSFLLTTGGTQFNCVAKHMIQHQIRAAILLSDGQGYLTVENTETLKSQLEHLIYIKVEQNDYRNWEHIATETIYLMKRR